MILVLIISIAQIKFPLKSNNIFYLYMRLINNFLNSYIKVLKDKQAKEVFLELWCITLWVRLIRMIFQNKFSFFFLKHLIIDIVCLVLLRLLLKNQCLEKQFKEKLKYIASLPKIFLANNKREKSSIILW